MPDRGHSTKGGFNPTGPHTPHTCTQADRASAVATARASAATAPRAALLEEEEKERRRGGRRKKEEEEEEEEGGRRSNGAFALASSYSGDPQPGISVAAVWSCSSGAPS